MTESLREHAARPPLPACVERWPQCEEGAYDPRCCRFPKSCSCTIYDDQMIERGIHTSPLEEQAREVLSLLRNHLLAYGERLDRDQRRSISMAIHRLERGLADERGTDPARSLDDWIDA